MKKLFIASLLCTGLFGATVAQADLVELSDSEMQDVQAQMDLSQALYGLIQYKVSQGANITPEEMMDTLNIFMQKFGVDLGKVTFIGTEYGNLSLHLMKDGRIVGTSQLPSSFERIEIPQIRIGGGASIGSMEIHNLRITGQITVSFTK